MNVIRCNKLHQSNPIRAQYLDGSGPMRGVHSDTNLRHGVASVIQPPPILLVEGLTERMSGRLAVISGVDPPRDVLRGVRGGSRGAGQRPGSPRVNSTGLDGDRYDALLLLAATVGQVEPQVLLGLSRGRLAVRLRNTTVKREYLREFLPGWGAWCP